MKEKYLNNFFLFANRLTIDDAGVGKGQGIFQEIPPGAVVSKPTISLKRKLGGDYYRVERLEQGDTPPPPYHDRTHASIEVYRFFAKMVSE